MVIGGNTICYGAPLLTALGVQAAGADLIWLALPICHQEAAKGYGLNFFLRPFATDILTPQHISQILADVPQVDVVVLGNGLGKAPETLQALLELLPQLTCPVVLDAQALFPEILKVKPRQADWILTPHQGEFKRLFQMGFDPLHLKQVAAQHQLTIVLKGSTDYVANSTHFAENTTGCPQMRVGGTGDVLAGIIASYRAQKLSSFDAAVASVYYFGKAGEKLSKQRYTFTAQQLAMDYHCLNSAETS